MKPRPGARLMGLKQAEAEFGVPYGTLYMLVRRGDLPSVQLPGVRRLYQLKFQRWPVSRRYQTQTHRPGIPGRARLGWAIFVVTQTDKNRKEGRRLRMAGRTGIASRR